MDNGFTGFDPMQANRDLDKMQKMCSGASGYVGYLCQSVCSLSELWASPKAVEFGNTFVPRLENLWKSLLDDLNVIMTNTARAIDTVAGANGYRGHGRESITTFSSSIVTLSNPFKEELDGNVGMNIMQVNLKKAEIEKKVSQVNYTIESIEDTDIALYDPDGAQKAAYKSMLAIFKSTMDELVSEIKTAIDSAIETEVNNIRLAKENATSVMTA